MPSTKSKTMHSICKKGYLFHERLLSGSQVHEGQHNFFFAPARFRNRNMVTMTQLLPPSHPDGVHLLTSTCLTLHHIKRRPHNEDKDQATFAGILDTLGKSDANNTSLGTSNVTKSPPTNQHDLHDDDHDPDHAADDSDDDCRHPSHSPT